MIDVALYSISQIRDLEQAAMVEQLISERELMQRAGIAAFEALINKWPRTNSILVFAGIGNNGGDGYVLAKIARAKGISVNIRYLGQPEIFAKTAAQVFVECQQQEIDIQPFNPLELLEVDVVVDALLGIGLNKEVQGSYREAITFINDLNKPVLSLDVPSGLDANTGSVLGVAIKASCTVTFIGLKQGLFTKDALDYCQDVRLATLDLAKQSYQAIMPAGQLLIPDLIKQCLTPRKQNSQKGDYGHTLVIGGDKGMGGAVRLAAEAALRVGSGLVSVATIPENVSLVCAHHPEIMCHGIGTLNDLERLLAKASVLVIGPGLGQEPWGREILGAALSSELPKVIDADALNLLGPHPVCQDNWVLTPHPGEASRLLSMSAKQVQDDRFSCIDKLAKNGGTWILKGAGTLIKKDNEPFSVCRYGNPGMASGGMGDALSGIIGGLIAQKLATYEAAKLGVLVHSLAGDNAAQSGQRGLLASDLINSIRKIINVCTSLNL